MRIRCKVLNTTHSDINPGDKGHIVEVLADGYAVEITKSFKRANKIHRDGDIETRIIFFPKHHIKKLRRKTK